LEIIGNGPERAALEKTVVRTGLRDKVHFWGTLPFSEVQEKLARARLLVLPSLCFEGFPMVIREAFALGVPVAASSLGSMAEIVTDGKTGALFYPGDASALLAGVQALWNNQERLAEMGSAARREFEEQYTTDRNHRLLMEIYRAAMEQRKTRKTMQ
jgi:glycosyltransferase involved in cell wall biosynthesis